MCRLLLVKSEREFPIAPYLETFAQLCRVSSEYQGDGWGAMFARNGIHEVIKDLEPIWSHDFEGLGSTRFLLAHARSAFRDSAARIEHNMPFTDDRYGFVFNGELHGVRVQAEGRIGAEKIFNLIRRFDHGDAGEGFKRAITVIRKRSAYIRAMNIILTDTDRVFLCSFFAEQPDYFTLHIKRQDGFLMICSDPFPNEPGWSPVPNDTVEVFA